MKKSSLKLYFATALFTLTLASLTFAGDAQCPAPTPPPPSSGGRLTVIVIQDTIDANFKLIKDFLSALIKF
jgi:hypothetical protein